MTGKVVVTRVLKSSNTFGGQVPPHRPVPREEIERRALLEAINAVTTDHEILGSVRPSTIDLCRKAAAIGKAEDSI